MSWHRTRKATACVVALACAGSGAATATGPDPEAVLATVGQEEIPVAAIQAELDAKVLETKGELDPTSPDERRAALNRLVERRLFYLGTMAEIPGAQAVADSVRFHEQIRATWLSLKRGLHSGPEALTPEEIARFREARASAWHGRHILVNTTEDLNEALRLLESGEPFEDVAREISIDIGSAAAGGLLFQLRKGDWYPELIDLAFSLSPGEYGGPVTSRLGYHIMKCDSVSEASEDPNEFSDYNLRRLLMRKAEFDGIEAVIDEHLERFGIEVNAALVDSILLHIQPVGDTTKPPKKTPGWTPPTGALAVSAHGDTMTVADYFAGYDVLRGYDWPIPHNRTSVHTSVERLMVAYVLRREMREGTFDPGPVARAEVDAVVHRHLGNMYFNQILDPGPVDSLRAEELFRENPEGFTIPERASIAILGVSSAAYADSVERWLADGMSFSTAGRRISDVDDGGWYYPPTPMFAKGQFPGQDELVFSQLDVGEVSPRERISTGFQYYYLAQRKPPRIPKRIELTIEMLTETARGYLLHEARLAAIERLRDQYPVDVQDAVLQEVLHARL